MPILNRAAELQDEVTAWRRHLHQNPELNFNVFKTAEFVTEKLKEFGCDEVVGGIGRTGVVGVIKGSRGEGPVVGLRADMDALPMTETSGVPHASTTSGAMHACGHDGHTAMLLGAAKYLAETRNFAGAVAVIFQPAEEGGGGGNEMVKDGMMERFGIRSVYGLHNMPNMPVGSFAIKPGPIMASTAEFKVTITGKGGHAAMPHTAVDPIVAGAAMISALQTIVSRSADPVEALVVTVTKFRAGQALNIIPETAEFAGTVRTLKPELTELARTRFHAICEGVAAAHGASVKIGFKPGYPVTVNHAEEAALAADVAASVVGPAQVELNTRPVLGAEDFSYMLLARPGAFIFMGNGPSANLHHPAYDFNDEAIPFGISYWAQLAERALAA
ncbi:MAG TPA: M20 aminoacylase family protein [Mesorhizobium sp.]|jgi:hippurate hydrolase|nr:M20 aminoacylase family protein [Mesorhizobium sp.]